MFSPQVRIPLMQIQLATFLKGDTIMRSYIPLLAVAFLALVLGCKEGTPGGPGAKTNAPSPSSSSTASRTTTVETPDGSTTTKVEVEKPVCPFRQPQELF